MRQLAGLIIIAAVVASGPSAWAQPGGNNPASPNPADMSRAKALFQSAEALKQKGDTLSAQGDTVQARAEYGLAARDYLEGYKLSKLPLFLYNLGSIYRLRDNKQWAIRCYRAFVDSKPEDEKDLRDALTFIAGLEHELAEGAEEADADPFIDPSGVCVLEDDPAPRPVEPVEPVEPEPADPEPTPAGAQDLGQPVDQPQASSGRGYRIGFWITSGVTVAGIGGMVVFMMQTSGYEDDKEEAILAYQQTTGMQFHELDACADAEGKAGAEAVVDACDSGKRAATLSNTFQGVAMISAVAAGYFLHKGYLQKREPAQAPASATRITPVIGPGAVGAELTLRF